MPTNLPITYLIKPQRYTVKEPEYHYCPVSHSQEMEEPELDDRFDFTA